MFSISLCAIITAAILNGATAPAEQLGFYSNATVVIEVDPQSDVVTCLDFNGNEWAFLSAEDWYVGDLVSFIMCDNGTEIIFDDIICEAKYCGFIDGNFSYDYSSDLPLAIFK